MYRVAKGGTLRTTWSLWRPVAVGLPTETVDPDEFPDGPRFSLWAAGLPVQELSEWPYSQRLGKGVFSFVLPIPLGDLLEEGTTYTLRIDHATVGGQPCVAGSGVVPSVDFVVLPGAADFTGERLYVDEDELFTTYGVSPKPSRPEVLFAQGLLDDWMHRSLWPSVIERERKELPPDRNLLQLIIRPIIRIYSMVPTEPVDAAGLLGRYGYGRRDRRTMNQTSGAYLSVMAVMGSPPRFIPIDVAQVEFHPATGEVWIPTGFFLVNYSQVEVTYEAGYRTIPRAAKMSVAETIAWVRVKGFSPLTSWSIGRVSHNAGQDSDLLTPTVKRRMEPFRAKFLS